MAKAPTPGPPAAPLNLVTTSRFEKDAARARKRKLDMTRLVAIVDALRNRRPPAPHHRDHALTGDWSGCRECHIQPDWLLIYHIDGDDLILDRTGTHSDLFA